MSNPKIYDETRRLLQSGQPTQAVQLMRHWLEANPGDEIGLSMLGSALMKLDRLDQALGVFEEAIRLHPHSFAAHGDLAFAHMTAGNEEKAIAAFERAVAMNERFYQGWCYLGKLYFEAQQLEQATRSFDRAAALDPFESASREIQDDLNNSRLAAAEKRAREILLRQPGHAKASFALAHLASTVGAFEEAADILSVAIGNFPCDLNLRSALINSLEEVGDYRRALNEAHAAAAMDSGNAARWLTIGRIHGHTGQYAEALAAYDKALSLTPAADEQARGNLELLRGHILKILGRHAESVGAYRASAANVQGSGAAWWGLADLKTHRFGDADLEEMRRLAADASIKPEQRSQAAFALGKGLEDGRRYEEAFRAYEQANAIRPGVAFNPDDYAQYIDELIEAFTTDVLAQKADPEPAGPTPIFIVGLPRSGSTLIEQILASHSAIEGTMELVNLPNLLRRIRIDGGRRKLSYPRSMAGFTAAELAAYGQRYIEATAMYRSGKPYFIDKMPTNFDKVGLIHMLLPSAVVIDARRHPLDCGFSCFKQHFAGGHNFSYSLENIAHYFNGYLKLMDHWDRVLPGKVLCVRYEHLVERTKEVVTALLDHCGLAFEEPCLQFFENARPVRTASSEQVRQPIYSKGVGHWMNFERQLQPLANALGPATLERFSL